MQPCCAQILSVSDERIAALLAEEKDHAPDSLEKQCRTGGSKLIELHPPRNGRHLDREQMPGLAGSGDLACEAWASWGKSRKCAQNREKASFDVRHQGNRESSQMW